VTGAFAVRAPLNPVIVNGNDPAVILAPAVIVSVVVPEVVIPGGLKAAVVPAGTPLTTKLTGPAKPPAGATLTV
jgi:hypothetical protein